MFCALGYLHWNHPSGTHLALTAHTNLTKSIFPLGAFHHAALDHVWCIQDQDRAVCRAKLTARKAQIEEQIARARESVLQAETWAKSTMWQQLQEAICKLQACQVFTLQSAQPLQRFERAAAPASAFRRFREGAQSALPDQSMAEMAVQEAEQCLERLQIAAQRFTTQTTDMIQRIAAIFHLGFMSYMTCLQQLPDFSTFCASFKCSALQESQAAILHIAAGIPAAALPALDCCLEIRDMRSLSLEPGDMAKVSLMFDQVQHLQVIAL